MTKLFSKLKTHFCSSDCQNKSILQFGKIFHLLFECDDRWKLKNDALGELFLRRENKFWILGLWLAAALAKKLFNSAENYQNINKRFGFRVWCQDLNCDKNFKLFTDNIKYQIEDVLKKIGEFNPMFENLSQCSKIHYTVRKFE